MKPTWFDLGMPVCSYTEWMEWAAMPERVRRYSLAMAGFEMAIKRAVKAILSVDEAMAHAANSLINAFNIWEEEEEERSRDNA